MNKLFKFFFIFLFIKLLAGCSPTSSTDYQTLAAAEINRFTILLKKIHDPSELKKRQEKIKKRFNALSQILIDYRTYLEKHPEVEGKRYEKLQIAAQNLKEELCRIYSLDGGMEIVEEAQKDAYIKLSLFEQSLSQEKIDMFKSSRPLSKN